MDYLSDICRLCLMGQSKENFKMLLEITEEQQRKFEDITQTTLTLGSNYPLNMCSDCSDNLEQFHFYKNQLIRKQKELAQFLKFTSNSESFNVESLDHCDNLIEEDEAITCIIEELSDDEIFEPIIDDTEELQEVEEQSCNEFFQLVSEEETQDESVYESVQEQFEYAESENDTECGTLPDKRFSEVAAVPRVDELRYEKTTPTLVLTSNYLKAREALKNLPKSQEEYIAPNNMSLNLTVDSKDKVVYACKTSNCSMVFKTKHFYDKHVDLVHRNYQFMCSQCGKIFETKIQLRSHFRNHDQTLKFKCTFKDCDKAFRVKHHLVNHLRVHSKDSPFCCTFEGCLAKFRQKHALTIHLRKHNKDFKICTMCNSPFLTQFQLNKHLDKCDGTFKPLVTRGKIYDRRDSINTDEFKCCIEGCGSSFKAKVTLEKHLSKVHQINTETVCVLCCEMFSSQQELKFHLRDHLPFTCMVCSANFRNEENLKNHMVKSHEKDEVRLHRCQECQVSFKRAEHLKSHITYKHNKARPYSCDSCSYTSPTRSDLKSHMKKHVKEKGFSCRLCNFEARKLSTVKVHMKNAHETEEYYFCLICKEGFRYQNELHQHQKEFHDF